MPMSHHEPDIWMVFQSALFGPAIALFVVLILGALAVSGKFSITLARILLLAALVVAGLGLWGQPFWLLAPAIAVITIGLIALGWYLRPAVIPQYFGRLLPKRTLFSTSSPSSNPMFEIGNSGAVFIWKGPQGEPIFKFYGSTLAVEKIGKRAFVSTSLADTNGRVIAELIRNEWKVAPPPHTWDRNYNRDTLEVKNPEGRIILQVRVLPDRIQLQGEWWGGQIGTRLMTAPGGEGAQIEMFGPGQRPHPSEVIKPLFKYPSDKNLGILL